MSERMTVSDFIGMLTKVASGAPGESWLRINGEYVNEMSMVLQNPAVQEVQSGGMIEVKADATSRRVFDILTNGREPRPLPIPRIDLRR